MRNNFTEILLTNVNIRKLYFFREFGAIFVNVTISLVIVVTINTVLETEIAIAMEFVNVIRAGLERHANA